MAAASPRTTAYSYANPVGGQWLGVLTQVTTTSIKDMAPQGGIHLYPARHPHHL